MHSYLFTFFLSGAFKAFSYVVYFVVYNVWYVFIQNDLTNDPEVIVQVAFAENIACLAETALRFLEIVQLNTLNAANQEKEPQFQYQVSFQPSLFTD